jgi:hypothetical protein
MSTPRGFVAFPDRFSISEPIALRELTRLYLQWCLDRADGNQSKAADMACVSVRTIYTYTKTDK